MYTFGYTMHALHFEQLRFLSTYNLLVSIRYVKAKHSPGELLLSGPRMDVESGKMIVTLAKTLMIRYLSFQANLQMNNIMFSFSNSKFVSSHRDQVLGVAAVDFKLTHLFHLMTENYDQCNMEEYG